MGQPSLAIHDFATDLEWSLEANGDDAINAFYFRAIPHLERIEVVTNLALQKRGIDKILHLCGGKSLFVDKKKRRKDYGDILLEEYSNYERRTVGWLGKEKYTDYIAYIVMPTKTVYLLPFLLLQMAWQKHYSDWLAKYGRKFSPNMNYHTSNVAIPKVILLAAIWQQMTIGL